jgi:hypothetical protein
MIYVITGHFESRMDCNYPNSSSLPEEIEHMTMEVEANDCDEARDYFKSTYFISGMDCSCAEVFGPYLKVVP